MHGGDDPTFIHPTKVDERILNELKGIQKLAPLHTAANLTGIESVTKLFKDVPQYHNIYFNYINMNKYYLFYRI